MRNPCCCISLKTGSLLIALVEIAQSALFAGIYLYALFSLASIHSTNDNVQMQAVKENVQRANPEMSDQEPGAIFKMLYTILGLLCATCVLQAAFAFFLMMGVRQERLRLLKLWMVFKASSLAFTVIFTIAAAIMQHKQKTHGEVAINVISILLGQYFLYVVYRLYREIQANTRNQHRPKPNLKSKQEYYG